MIPPEFAKALMFISDTLHDIPWMLIGSTNHALQGMDVTPHDIDVIIDSSYVQEAHSLFSQSTKIVAMKSGAYKFDVMYNNISMEIIAESPGDLFRRISDLKNATTVKLHEKRIPCFPLVKEVEAYKNMGREHTAKMIMEFIHQ